MLREGLVRLFASLLRREDDGDYYLVTPREKWRIAVDRHPLLVIDCEYDALNSRWQALLNTGGRCQIGGPHALHGEGEAAEPFLEVPSGLTAQITRAAWYRLIDAAEQEGAEMVIYSAGERIVLGRV